MFRRALSSRARVLVGTERERGGESIWIISHLRLELLCIGVCKSYMSHRTAERKPFARGLVIRASMIAKRSAQLFR